jgi:hypothetical protein
MGSVISSVIQAANDRLERQRVLEGERFMEELERRGCVSRGQWAKPYSSYHSSQTMFDIMSHYNILQVVLTYMLACIARRDNVALPHVKTALQHYNSNNPVCIVHHLIVEVHSFLLRPGY